MVAHPSPPQIRARRVTAPGSSSQDISSRSIHRRCVDTIQSSTSLACFPSTVPETTSPFLPRVPRDGSPASPVLLRCYDALSPSRRASFPSLGGTVATPAYSLPQGADALCCGPGRLVSRSPAGTRPRRSQGSPRFLGGPPCVHALGWYPGGPSTLGHLKRRGCCLPLVPRRRLPDSVSRG